MDQSATPSFPAKSELGKHTHLLIITNILLLICLIVALYFLFQKMKAKPYTIQYSPVTNHAPPLPGTDPNSKTATRYFPVKTAAIDFRDGAEGDFSTSITKKANTSIEVTWDKKIRVAAVTVYDAGSLDDLTDHTVVFAVSYIKPVQQKGKQPTPPAMPTTFLTQPYTVGEIPAGYYNVTPGTTGEKIGALFQQGKRYSIEITGYDNANTYKSASYTFTY